MTQAHWSDVWNTFCSALAGEPGLLQIAIVLGIALVAVMVLEGVHAILFPGRFIRRHHAARPAPEPGLLGEPQEVDVAS